MCEAAVRPPAIAGASTPAAQAPRLACEHHCVRACLAVTSSQVLTKGGKRRGGMGGKDTSWADTNEPQGSIVKLESRTMEGGWGCGRLHQAHEHVGPPALQ